MDLKILTLLSQFMTFNFGGVNIRSETPVCFLDAESHYYLAFSPSPIRTLVLTPNRLSALNVSQLETPILATFDAMPGKGIKIDDSTERVVKILGRPNRSKSLQNKKQLIYFAIIDINGKPYEHQAVYTFVANQLSEITVTETKKS